MNRNGGASPNKPDKKKLTLTLNQPSVSKSKHTSEEIGSPVGIGLVGLRYIDDTGSTDNLLDPGCRPSKPADESHQSNEIISQGGLGQESDSNDDVTEGDTAILSDFTPILGQPSPELFNPCLPPGLECLLDTGQVVVHLGNLRENLIVDESTSSRMEVIDETRRVLLHVEQDDHDLATDSSFRFRIYDKHKREVIQVFSPRSTTCVCCGASWHCLKRCRFQSIVYTPIGTVAGFVRRSRTKFVQEFQILNASEEALLLLRGGPQDLEIYSLDLEDELGRLSVHGWAGIMHEVRRTSGDYGLTFPIDLDVRVKAVLIGAVFSLHWLYSTKGGKKKRNRVSET